MIIFVYLAKKPSNAFIALNDLVSLELCHTYLPNLFSKESILKTDRLTKEMIDKARDICKLSEVRFYLFILTYLIKSSFRIKQNVFMKYIFFYQ